MMSDVDSKVIEAKTNLMVALGDNVPRYLNNMKLWFRQKVSKEQFDYESRKLLSKESAHLHNKFLLAILNKIDAFHQAALKNSMPSLNELHARSMAMESANRNRKRKRSKPSSERVLFEPYDIMHFIPEDSMRSILPAAGTEANVQILPTQRYCVQELFLPDPAFIMGRFLIGAWEEGLANVEDTVADYVSMAVQVLLKNILSAIIMKRKHYKVTGEGSFYYDVGAPLKDPSLCNTVTRQKVDDGPLELDKEITSPNFSRRPFEEGTFLSACEEVYPQTRNRITLKDVQRALSDRNLLASHSVYAINMERLTQMMH